MIPSPFKSAIGMEGSQQIPSTSSVRPTFSLEPGTTPV